MLSIFYDLETTDKNPIGQILNYCFVAVDKNWRPVGELSGGIRISRLQLPDPHAILANRTNVLRHQEQARSTEQESAKKIYDFILNLIETGREPVRLIGFNSSKFDLLYLRTTLIRNGINPYFNGKLIYRDVLQSARKLCATKDDFPRTYGENGRLTLSLESLCRSLGLLIGSQAHHSGQDVLLTIELARCLLERFSLDVRTFEGYEGRCSHNVKKGTVYKAYQPNYDPNVKELCASSPVTLLDCNHRYALWIDLEKYKAGLGKESIFWINFGTGALFIEKEPIKGCEELALAALKEFQKVNLSNFFEVSSCDIEQDIYRLDFDMIDHLHASIWHGKNLPSSKGRDMKVVYLRNILANHEFGKSTEADSRISLQLKQYAEYRYGGKANLSKRRDKEERHLTLEQLLSEVDTLLNGVSDAEDKELLEALRAFYLKSEIYKVLKR